MRRFVLARCVVAAFLGLAMFVPLAIGQGASPVADALSTGRVGALRIEMAQQDIESLLQRSLAADLDHQSQIARVTLFDVHDLQSLGVDQIAGVSAQGVDLIFTTPVGGDRRLRSVVVGIPCNDLLDLVQRIGAWEPPDRKSDYLWGIHRRPQCQLSLWKQSDQ